MCEQQNDKNAEIREQRKLELKLAATELFGKKGFASTKISDITSAANLSHGLFYHYFSSKEELYGETIYYVLDVFIDTVQKTAEREGTARDQLLWLTRRTHNSTMEAGVFRHILILQGLYSEGVPEEMKRKIMEKYEQAIHGVGSIIAKGQQEGLFIEGDPYELAVYHLSLAHGLLLWNAKQLNPIELSAEKVLRQLEK